MRELFAIHNVHFILLQLFILLMCSVSARELFDYKSNEFVNFDDFCLDIPDDDDFNCAVQTYLGAIWGKSFTTIFDGQIFCAYRGIPYALPPTGSRRFRVIIDILW